MNICNLSRNRVTGASAGHGGELLLTPMFNEGSICDLVPHVRSRATRLDSLHHVIIYLSF